MENPGELHRNVTTPYHQHALWQLFKKERLVGADRVFVARDLRNLRPAAGSDQYVFGRVALAIDLHFVGTGQFGVTFHQGDTTVDQQVAVDAIETMNFTVLVGDQGWPVKVRFTQTPAKP